MRVKLPHDLPREEVRRRMRAHSDEIASFFPAGLAKVTTSWSSDDRMDITAEVVATPSRAASMSAIRRW